MQTLLTIRPYPSIEPCRDSGKRQVRRDRCKPRIGYIRPPQAPASPDSVPGTPGAARQTGGGAVWPLPPFPLHRRTSSCPTLSTTIPGNTADPRFAFLQCPASGRINPNFCHTARSGRGAHVPHLRKHLEAFRFHERRPCEARIKAPAVRRRIDPTWSFSPCLYKITCAVKRMSREDAPASISNSPGSTLHSLSKPYRRNASKPRVNSNVCSSPTSRWIRRNA